MKATDSDPLANLTDPLTRSTSFGYDDDGRLTSTTNPESEETTHSYNLRGDKLSTTDALLQTIDYAFDANGNRTQIENRREFDFDFDYDPNNRLSYSRTPLGFETNQNWNPRGLLDWVEEPSGQTTTFLYDSMGRVDSKTDPVSTVDYGYDNNGNLTTVTEGAVTISRGYDNRNRVTSYTDALGNTYGYQYDGNGNLTLLTYPGGKTVDYDYNTHNQLIKITDWNSRETDYSYDLKGRLTQISRPNGTARSMSYDDADQVTRIEERKSDGTLILLFSFQYDQAGRITEEFAGPLPKEYTPQTYTATYDADNRLATFNSNPVFHDNDGNMTVGPLLDDTLKTYSYNARNQLKSIAGTTYSYDAEGNRISSTVGSATTSYAIDPNTGLSKVLIRTKPGGEKTYYVYGMGLVYEIDESENTSSYHYDYRGSTRFMTDDSELVTDSVEYSPYGVVTHRTGSTDTPFLYNGAFGVMAEANGLYHMRARFYNPYTRRFVNPDPIGFSGGMNMYAYANGNPASFNDPEGEVANFIIGGAIGGGLDYAFQVGTNLAQGQSLGNSLRNVDIGSILISTGTGALTGGLSGVLVKQTGKIAVSNATRVGLNTVGNASINAGGAAGGQVVRNFSGGRELDANIGEAIAFGFVTGGAGSIGGEALESGINSFNQSLSRQTFQSASLTQRLFGISNAIDLPPTNNYGAPYGTVVGSAISNQPLNPFIKSGGN